jgi:hypothetical protein
MNLASPQKNARSARATTIGRARSTIFLKEFMRFWILPKFCAEAKAGTKASARIINFFI